ncbi:MULTISPECIES: methyl-accepting chemotaxis protein [Alphaproteobacteria]|nr:MULTISPECIES: methyl-accepting chemotaxis protein [Alphaproteobacteria]GLR24226.1 methyl-accepting chemotaxis protein [Ciceribacter naphthalenivorans]GLT07082.1 methyl-accepting chemotaxis protein [Sphingomonas psychrolutea]
MLKFISRSIAAKLLVVTGVAIAFVLMLSNVFLIFETRDRVQALTMQQATAEAAAIAEEIAGDIGELASAARTMSGVLSRGHEGKSFDRKGAMNLLKANLEQNPFAFGSWFAEEEKAFDGRKDDIINNIELGANANGVFTPYWSKDRNGEIQFSTFNNDYTAEWYALVAKSGKGAITAPYLADGTDVPTTMSSIAYPVVSGGKMIGVTGVDISLASLSEKLKALRPFETGRVMLVAENSQWLVAPSDDLLMKPYEAAGADALKTALSNRKSSLVRDLEEKDGSGFDRLLFPFEVPGVNATWSVIVDIPHSATGAAVEAQTMLMIIAGLIVLGAVMASLFFAVRAFAQKPLQALLNDVGQLSEGNYETAVKGQERSDELGRVAQALEEFRHRLSNSRALEREAEQQRNAADAERRRSEQERSESLGVQQHVVSVLGAGLAQLSQGNLGYRISDDFSGEYAALKRDFNEALASLESTITAVNSSVVNIGAGSGEIADSAADLSKRTEQQAASLEETAAALNELTEQVNASADNANTAAATVNLACQDAEKSGEVVKKAVASMHGIAQSSQEISRIIGVIDEIAFQTNLLALNAGVEAARAGEAGKGFAVVAQEVRELAQRSANAAKEIKTLINTSGAQVKDGVELVGQAGQTLHKIADQVMQINDLIRQISASASEQASGLKEINSAVNQMDQVTQQNAAMVEETTAASMTLRNESENLKGLVSQFSTSGANVHKAISPASASASPLAAVARTMRSAAPGPVTTPRPALKRAAAGGAAPAVDDWQEF